MKVIANNENGLTMEEWKTNNQLRIYRLFDWNRNINEIIILVNTWRIGAHDKYVAYYQANYSTKKCNTVF